MPTHLHRPRRPALAGRRATCAKRPSRALVLALFAALLAVVATPASAQHAEATDASVGATFVRACATCHGADGSGTGPTVLDRPARDFKSGGFSFGNTPDALFRTITYGIPGTPMPAFGSAYPEAERVRLAEYVRSLGPPVEELDASDRVVVVTDRPRVVRGILPPVVENAPLRPRGLLIGTPEGLAFEYRIDGLRLLAVRQGEFVERTDWVGRGGTPLKPLGVPILVFDEGDPGPTFEKLVPYPEASVFGFVPSNQLKVRLLSTLESGHSVELRQSLFWFGWHAADVTETVAAVTGPTGVAWERRFTLHERAGGSWTLAMPLVPPSPEAPPSVTAQPAQVLSTLPDGRVACLQLDVDGADMSSAPVVWCVEHHPEGIRLLIDATPGRLVRFVVRTILLPEWTDATRAALAAWEPVR
jgi:mono/diheme cytochrome c family protein